jgi:glycosyltransferase involved in cell wall biosynthesis
MNRPRIALLLPTIDQIGGAERQVLLLAKELSARSWHVTLITLSGTGAEESPQLAHHGVNYLSLGMRKAWVDPQGWLRYLAWHRKNKPAILHAHLPHSTWFARWSRLLAPVPVLIDTLHTSNPGPITRQLAYRLTDRLSTHITCVSHSVAGVALGNRITRASKLTVLPNGVILPPAHPASPQSANPFRWLSIGRLAPVKDYSTLLHAFAALPSRPILTIAGTGPEEQSLRTLAHQLQVADRIHFAGFQSDIQPLLAAADAFVLSSLWEGLPISILEAQAASLPIVATDTPGTREAMLLNQSGLLVPVSAPQSLAQAMSEIMSMSLTQRAAMGAQGRKLIQSRFSLSAVVDQWETLYRNLLNGR